MRATRIFPRFIQNRKLARVCSRVPEFNQLNAGTYGRGNGVGRGLGGGATLGVGEGLCVIVGLAVAVAVAVGEGVCAEHGSRM